MIMFKRMGGLLIEWLVAMLGGWLQERMNGVR
jgi:hypothetical protein